MNDIEKIETDQLLTSTFDHTKFKNAVVVITVTHWYLNVIKASLDHMMRILKETPDVYLVILDNHSNEEIKTYLRSLKHDRVECLFLDHNIGKALLANNYTRHFITPENCPRVVCSLDPDTLFSTESFNYLTHAVAHLPRIGMLGMRYTNNGCNPEQNLWLPARRFRGTDGERYHIKVPLFCNVAGPIFAVRGDIFMKDLKFRLFPKAFIRTYGGDDSATHNALKSKYISGYLNGTLATHLKSGDTLDSSML